MDAVENEIATWLKSNGIDGDTGAAEALYSALSLPGHYGALAVVRHGQDTVVTGPAGVLTLSGGEDIQALRLRLEEIFNHPGRPVV